MDWTAFVDDAGNFAIDHQQQFDQWVKKHAGRELVVTVRRRSYAQGTQSMRYYRGVVVPDATDAMGGLPCSEDWRQTHEGFAWKFLRLPDGPMGEPRRLSTARDVMPQDKMSWFIDQCILWIETSVPGARIRRPHEVDLNSVYAMDYDKA